MMTSATVASTRMGVPSASGTIREIRSLASGDAEAGEILEKTSTGRLGADGAPAQNSSSSAIAVDLTRRIIIWLIP